jgi:serine/threonine-protein kinase
MEYLEGQPLSSIIHRARDSALFSREMHLRVISEALSGLHYAHELADFDGRPLGVVHRDVSPHNVFVTFDGQVKLLDFGIAKLSGAQIETATGVIKGKLRYMAPEQIAGEGVDRRVDIFAVGVMLWEAAANDKMWKGLAEAAIMNRIINDELPDLVERCPDVAPELAAIVKKALANDPAARYQTAQALQDDIEHYLAQRGSTVRLRDLGKVVQELFADTREETRRTVEAQLAKVGSLSAAEYAATTPIELTHIGVTGTSTTARERSTLDAPEQARRAWILPLLALVTVLLLIVLWRGRSPSHEPPAAIPSPGPAKAAVATNVVLRFTAFPGSSKLYLDGELLPSNPASKSVPIDDRVHVLEARADGFASEKRELRFDQNQEIVLALNSAPRAASSAPQVAGAKRHPAAATSKPVASAAPSAKPAGVAKGADCNPPYTLDARGVKQFKLHCL